MHDMRGVEGRMIYSSRYIARGCLAHGTTGPGSVSGGLERLGRADAGGTGSECVCGKIQPELQY